MKNRFRSMFYLPNKYFCKGLNWNSILQYVIVCHSVIKTINGIRS